MNALEKTIVKNLPDLCASVLAYGLSLRIAHPGSSDDVREKVASMFEAIQRDARSHGVDSHDVDLARFALCAFLDELLLSPGREWEGRDEWMLRPLQMDYFRTVRGGEEFFDKLEEARSRDRIDVLEVYALCMGLGFKGKYSGVKGMDELTRLVADLNSAIKSARGVKDDRLSGDAVVSESVADHVKRIPLWWFAAASAALLLVTMLVLDGWLKGSLEFAQE